MMILNWISVFHDIFLTLPLKFYDFSTLAPCFSCPISTISVYCGSPCLSSYVLLLFFVFKKQTNKKLPPTKTNPTVDWQCCILPVLVIHFVLVLLLISMSLKMGGRTGSLMGQREETSFLLVMNRSSNFAASPAVLLRSGCS